jgi:large subunit ribosomal protein L17
MRHRKANVKLNRSTSHRKAMFRNMVTSFFEHERIVTTEAKAKALRPLAEKMITLAKRGDLHSRRQALAVLTKKSVTHKLFDEIGSRYMESSGGYTTIAKLEPRRGDAAPMAVIELINPEKTSSPKKKKRKQAASKKPAEAKVKEPEPAEIEEEKSKPKEASVESGEEDS